MIERELPNARVVFSTREGGVSEDAYRSLNLGGRTGDDEERVMENRRRLAGAADLDPRRVAMGWQVHGVGMREWEAPPARTAFAERGAPLEKVDAHVTGVEGLALLVLVADCFPIALASGRRAAMLHCGWRGLAAGIVERALESFDEPPVAVVGPGIGPCCYEVGEEVLAEFRGADGAANGRMLDLRAIATARLRAGGVEEVEQVDLCTSCRADLFFSHRRDGGVTGRQAGFVWLR